MRRKAARLGGGVVIGGGVAAGAHAFGTPVEIVLAIAAAAIVIGVAVWLVSRRSGAQLKGKAQ